MFYWKIFSSIKQHLSGAAVSQQVASYVTISSLPAKAFLV